MTQSQCRAVLTALIISGIVCVVPSSARQPPPPPAAQPVPSAGIPGGGEELTRGPIHEAFGQPVLDQTLAGHELTLEDQAAQLRRDHVAEWAVVRSQGVVGHRRPTLSHGERRAPAGTVSAGPRVAPGDQPGRVIGPARRPPHRRGPPEYHLLHKLAVKPSIRAFR